MTFLILLTWTLVTFIARAFDVIDPHDMYIGMTILLASIYLECEEE